MREAEVQVLDQRHKQLPLWSRDPNTAMCSTLLAFDSFAIVMMQLSSMTGSIGVLQSYKHYYDGFGQAVRWLFPRITATDFHLRSTEDEVDFAGHFLNYTASYSILEALHMQFGKGLMSVNADRNNKIIRFVPRRDLPGRQSHLYFADLMAHRQQQHSRTSIDGSDAIIDRAVQTGDVTCHDGRIDSRCLVPLIGGEVRGASRHEMGDDIVPLLTDDNLVGFTYGEFDRFWLNLHAWSLCAVRIFLQLTNSGTPQIECLPTQVLDSEEFSQNMSDLSGLSRNSVAAITDFMTYDHRTPRPDPFLQPLFRFGNRVVWSSLAVVLSRQPRNALKLLCKTPATQNLGATLNGSRERRLLRRFGAYLEQRAGYAYKLNIPLSFRGVVSELDMLGYQRRTPTEVLLVQGKTPIAADDQHDIDSVTKDLIRGQKQCRTAERMLRAMSDEQKADLVPFVDWSKVSEFHALVITPDSEPHRLYDPSQIPAISLRSLEQRLRRRDRKRPSVLCEACRERPWLTEIGTGVLAYERVMVGDIAYEIPQELAGEE